MRSPKLPLKRSALMNDYPGNAPLGRASQNKKNNEDCPNSEQFQPIFVTTKPRVSKEE